jgi:hypothetical protein
VLTLNYIICFPSVHFLKSIELSEPNFETVKFNGFPSHYEKHHKNQKYSNSADSIKKTAPPKRHTASDKASGTAHAQKHHSTLKNNMKIL